MPAARLSCKRDGVRRSAPSACSCGQGSSRSCANGGGEAPADAVSRNEVLGVRAGHSKSSVSHYRDTATEKKFRTTASVTPSLIK